MEAASLFEPTVLETLRRYRCFVFAVVIVVVIPFGLYVSTRPAVYTANASLIVSDPRGPGVLGGENLAEPLRRRPAAGVHERGSGGARLRTCQGTAASA